MDSRNLIGAIVFLAMSPLIWSGEKWSSWKKALLLAVGIVGLIWAVVVPASPPPPPLR